MSKENPTTIEAREKVKEIYNKFQKDISHQQASATLTLAIVMKELFIELVRFSQKVNNGPQTESKAVSSPISRNGNVDEMAEHGPLVGDGNGENQGDNRNFEDKVLPTKKNQKNTNSKSANHS